MSFPRYADYKDSGIEWLGEVPGHWDIFPLKRDIAFLTSGSRGWAEHYSDDGAVFIRIGNLTRDSIRLNLSDLQRVEVPEGAEGERTKVMAGDVLFSITAYLGSVAIAPEGLETAYVSQHVALARLKQCLFLPAWVGYVALSYVGKTYLETQGYGGTKVQLSLDDVANLIMTAPPLPEQTAIAAFLDREMAKIDALVAEQEKLIALLAEKRQAVISHAVTKGLNPAAPMKDSGIEWLGVVPEHWEVVPLKHLAKIGNGSTPNRDEMRYWENGSYPWLNSSVVNMDAVTCSDVFVTEAALAECSLPRIVPPAVLVGITGEGRTRGMATTLLFEATINQHVAYVKPACGRLNVEYLRRFFDMAYERLRCESEGSGSTKGAITCGQLAQMCLPLPPTDEQFVIATFLDEHTARLDTLTAEARRAIDLLKEHRSALISAAVTGKIDVRGLVEAEAA